MSVITDEKKIDELLTRRVDSVYPSKAKLKKLLMSGKKIRLYQGFDPTGPRLHLGHSIGLRNLQSFADLGHEVIVVFGTGTVLVGDPSQRDTGRKLIDQAKIDANLEKWKSQVQSIVNFDNVSIRYNGDWLTKLSLKDVVRIASHISAVQLFKRDSFQKRLDKGDTVWYHETMYPLLQGYDSVAMDVDLELGGTDQMFNMLMGRDLQKRINDREKFVLTNPMVLGVDGNQMSKSSGNCIWLDDSPEEMYGKTMSIPDEQIELYMRMFTDLPEKEIKKNIKDPMAAKKTLAYEICKQFHGDKGAQNAQDHFETVVQNKQLPKDTSHIALSQLKTDSDQKCTILDITKIAQPDTSSSQLKQIIRQGGVEYNGKKVTSVTTSIQPKADDTLKIGKRNFYTLE